MGVGFAGMIEGAWWGALAATGLFFTACVAAPRRVARLQSNPWAFQPAAVIDLPFQSLLYAAYHTTRAARLTHTTLALDQVAWFVLAFAWSPFAALALYIVVATQAVLLREPTVLVPLSTAWWVVATLAYMVVREVPDGAVWAMATLLTTAVVRVLGHAGEPLPPGIGGRNDRFLPLKDAGLRVWEFGVIAVMAVLSEFASGLPWRLFPVQVSWLVQQFGTDPRRVPPWQKVRNAAIRVHARGWSAEPMIGSLFAHDAVHHDPPPGLFR